MTHKRERKHLFFISRDTTKAKVEYNIVDLVGRSMGRCRRVQNFYCNRRSVTWRVATTFSYSSNVFDCCCDDAATDDRVASVWCEAMRLSYHSSYWPGLAIIIVIINSIINFYIFIIFRFMLSEKSVWRVDFWFDFCWSERAPATSPSKSRINNKRNRMLL